MRSNLRTALIALGLAVGLAASMEAQTHKAHIGARASFDFDAEHLGVGAQIGIPVGHRVELYPSFDYFFVDDGETLWAVNADVKARIFGERLEWLYTGAGLALEKIEFGPFDDTDPGVNLFVGAETLRGRIHPFAEARLRFADRNSFVLAAGLNFTL
jgi:hypothetical protein